MKSEGGTSFNTETDKVLKTLIFPYQSDGCIVLDTVGIAFVTLDCNSNRARQIDRNSKLSSGCFPRAIRYTVVKNISSNFNVLKRIDIAEGKLRADNQHIICQ